ncbi:MAG: hypothetical protein PQJ61_08500 [Spirochaetales bacterium]|uniref:Uncharacterized protein n=1 Tax=Candidatus Thalassospirochaeta sargassi TaxID=3119039 RepID=A0AAJ1ICK5_9SPIO|nr:hypothetical protein [Spirochaetales bacterium]
MNDHGLKAFDDKIHLTGRLTMSIGALMLLAIPVIISLRWNIFPPFGKIASGVLSLSLIMVPMAFAEIFTYAPILGSGATYLGFLTGNLSNLKVPAAVMALEISDTDPASEDAEIISIISVATSAIVSAVIIFLGVLLIVPLSPVLSRPELKPAFDNVLPALFGALGAYWIMRNWKLAITPLVITILVFLAADVPTSAMIPLSALLSVIAARILYKKGLL